MRISELQMEAASLKQGDLTVTEFFTKLRTIWDELENFRPEPTCKCPTKCTCDVASMIKQRKIEDHAMQFLRGLNDQYSNIRSHVLLLEPIPPITKIFHYVAQQERHIGGNSFFPNTDAKINAVATISCTHCGKGGHVESTCYKKHGFPTNSDKGNRNNANRKVCTHCR